MDPRELPDDDYVVPLGKAAIRREGTDLSIITFGAMVYTALDAATTFADRACEMSMPFVCESQRYVVW